MVVPAAILAGGRSSRMGTDKALLDIGGTPLAVRTFNSLHASGCNPIHLVGRQPALHTLGIAVISDEDERSHPLYGLVAALSHCEHELMLIAPCDIPNLSPEHVQHILAYGQPCIAISDGRTHPLLGLFSVAMLSRARQIADENGSVHEFTQNMTRLDLPSPSLLNLNFPSDLPS
ncbi:MAG: molybdenum cofactor guanylyltransferase [Myxococcota bacterium]